MFFHLFPLVRVLLEKVAVVFRSLSMGRLLTEEVLLVVLIQHFQQG